MKTYTDFTVIFVSNVSLFTLLLFFFASYFFITVMRVEKRGLNQLGNTIWAGLALLTVAINFLSFLQGGWLYQLLIK